jgi:hypothetical protein
MTEDTKTSVAPDVSKYQKVKSASGGASLNNGDEVAQALTGATLDEVYRLASKALGETQKALKEKYEHLNEGMQRMNLGNRIRGAVAKMEEGGSEFLATEGAFIAEAVAKREEAAAAEKAKAAKPKAEAKPKKKRTKKAA